jgi:3-dehydrotetronate 4-kinase
MSGPAPVLGAIADDFTGATDLCNMLVKGGMRTVQLIGVPEPDLATPEADAIVVALKSRTCPPGQAVAWSLASLDWLRAAGCRQFFFKYCSTFDSTAQGNIGPVANALLEALDGDITIACPAYPQNGRTVYQGYLFVNGVPISESPMRDHPLTPMTDANLVRVLAAQSVRRVGLLPYGVVRQGPEAIREALADLAAQGVSLAVSDALEDQHLLDIGAAVSDLPLITGGSGVAMGLPGNYRMAGLLEFAGAAGELPRVGGLSAVLSGSCSAATLAQVAEMAAVRPALAIDPIGLAEGWNVVDEAVEWAVAHLDSGPILIHAGAPPEGVREIQESLGKERAGRLIEDALAGIARGLAAHGVRRLIVAGGETAGAVVQALGVQGLRIGPEIDPGVPWTVSLGDDPFALALKSGNFGSAGFFLKAWDSLS